MHLAREPLTWMLTVLLAVWCAAIAWPVAAEASGWVPRGSKFGQARWDEDRRPAPNPRRASAEGVETASRHAPDEGGVEPKGRSATGAESLPHLEGPMLVPADGDSPAVLKRAAEATGASEKPSESTSREDKRTSPGGQPAAATALDAPAELHTTAGRPLGADIEELVAAAYAKTAEAETVDDYSEIIAAGRQIEAAAEEERERDYARRLMSWAYNRRGQLRSRQAEQAKPHGETDTERLADLALADYEKAVELDPSRWKAIHNRGVSLAMKGALEAALDDFARTIKINPRHANAWFNRAGIRMELGRFDEAVGDFNQLVQLSPDDAAAYLGRGHCLMQLGQSREALADFSRAVGLAPNSSEVRATRADALAAMGQWQAAMSDYRAAVRLNPNDAPAWLGMAWLAATCPDPQYRSEKVALEAAQRAVQAGGAASPRLLDTLAAAYASSGDFRRATEMAQKAIASAPQGAKGELQKRLALYQRQLPYRQPRQDDNVQSAAHWR